MHADEKYVYKRVALFFVCFFIVAVAAAKYLGPLEAKDTPDAQP